MRKHGWQLPYHPLQVVAVAVFLALGFAFYVFFVPFVGKKVFQYVLMGIYTPLIMCVFCLYIWCAAADPADPGIFKSKKYLNVVHNRKQTQVKELTFEGESTSSTYDTNTVTVGQKSLDEGVIAMDRVEEDDANETQTEKNPHHPSCCMLLLGFCPCALICHCSNQPEESAEHQMSEDGMFFCSLCKVEVLKYSKHCRVCDKCVNSFDHHCRWINNCIGKKNYRQFVSLMVSALLLLILQWLTGILVMICACLERKRFAVEIASKLGSSFSMAPFIVVVAACTGLAMIATLPLAQLLFFHVLLIKKGISTYDYIIALREQEQQGGGQQSPQMSLASSVTGFSSASSFSTLQRGAWCTPPRLFFEDQFDVIPPDTRTSVSSSGKRMLAEEPIGKKNPGAVKISPWTLARLNAEEVSKAAAQARKKSKVLQPVVRRESPLGGLGRDNSFGSSSGHMDPKAENRRRANKRGRLPVDLPLEPLAKISSKAAGTSTSMAPLQLEARSAFRTSRAMSTSGTTIASSPESSLDSPDEHPFRVSSSGAEEARGLTALTAAGDGYEASGGEDSDRVSSRLMHRSTNWGKLLFNSDNSTMAFKFKPSSSSSQVGN